MAASFVTQIVIVLRRSARLRGPRCCRQSAGLYVVRQMSRCSRMRRTLPCWLFDHVFPLVGKPSAKPFVRPCSTQILLVCSFRASRCANIPRLKTDHATMQMSAQRNDEAPYAAYMHPRKPFKPGNQPAPVCLCSRRPPSKTGTTENATGLLRRYPPANRVFALNRLTRLERTSTLGFAMTSAGNSNLPTSFAASNACFA